MGHESKKVGGDEGGDSEMATELKPGDFAMVFHVDGDVEVFAAEGASTEQTADTRMLVDFVEFVLNDDATWARYAAHTSGEGVNVDGPPPGTLLN